MMNGNHLIEVILDIPRGERVGNHITPVEIVEQDALIGGEVTHLSPPSR